MSDNIEVYRQLIAASIELDQRLEAFLPELKEAPLDIQLQVLALAERAWPGTGGKLLQGKTSGSLISCEAMGLLEDD